LNAHVFAYQGRHEQQAHEQQSILLFTEEKTRLEVAYAMKTRSANDALHVGSFQAFLKNVRAQYPTT